MAISYLAIEIDGMAARKGRPFIRPRPWMFVAIHLLIGVAVLGMWIPVISRGDPYYLVMTLALPLTFINGSLGRIAESVGRAGDTQNDGIASN